MLERLRRHKWPIVLLAIALGVVGIARIPVSTNQGIDGTVTSHRLSLYAKTIDFLQRDSNYRRLAARAAGTDADDEARTLKLFDWTRANIRDTPVGFPIVDDHVWHIVIRGYGMDDQKVDVFTTLAAYAGLSAYWILLGDRTVADLPISLVQVDGRWRLLDVVNGVVFRNRDGALATPEELASDPALVAAGAGEARRYRDRPYAWYFTGFQAPIPPDITRAEMQMLWPRAVFQIKRLIGRGSREWTPRPLPQPVT